MQLNVIGLDKIQLKYKSLPNNVKIKFAEILEYEIKLNIQVFSDTGKLKNSIKVIPKLSDIIATSNVPYARIQNIGGTQIVTEKQRKRFWALFYQTGRQIYKASALSKTITIKAKNYTNVSPNKVITDLNTYIKKIIK